MHLGMMSFTFAYIDLMCLHVVIQARSTRCQGTFESPLIRPTHDATDSSQLYSPVVVAEDMIGVAMYELVRSLDFDNSLAGLTKIAGTGQSRT